MPPPEPSTSQSDLTFDVIDALPRVESAGRRHDCAICLKAAEDRSAQCLEKEFDNVMDLQGPSAFLAWTWYFAQ